MLWGALQVDLTRKAQTEEERIAADDLMSVLTPVIKGYLTDRGFETAVNAQQVFGGHGYIREWGMEQFVRDARIAQIYEAPTASRRWTWSAASWPRTAAAGSAPCSADRPRHCRGQGRGRSGGSPIRSNRRSATFRQRPCGLPRTAWPIPTMRARAPMPTCS